MRGLTLSWLAERNADTYPDEEAIVMTPVSGGRTAVTNATFDDRINQVATGLRERGLEQGDKVAVYTANSIPTIEVYLGAMRVGVLPVPVNASKPPSRPWLERSCPPKNCKRTSGSDSRTSRNPESSCSSTRCHGTRREKC